MNTSIQRYNKLTALAAVFLLLAGCMSKPTQPDGAAEIRSKLTRLQSDPQLASLDPVAIKDAEDAVRAAEEPRKKEEKALAQHLVFIADRKVDIALARAQSRLLEDQRKGLSAQREGARLDARTQEVDDLKRQLSELNAKETDRGLVVTLGDVLFDTGKSELKSGATSNLSKLAAFLNKYQNRSVSIEGYTDNVGGDDYNLALSQRRADAVKSYFMNQGIYVGRLSSSGRGEASPVASNSSASGRQLNRRVEVVISNAPTGPRPGMGH